MSVKYKPVRFPLTQAALKQKEWGWALGLGALEFIIAANEANAGIETWCCGNRNCNAVITVRGNKTPRVCTTCGGEINWVDIKTRLVKVCPTCDYRGTSLEKFCPWETPAVPLNDKEIPI